LAQCDLSHTDPTECYLNHLKGSLGKSCGSEQFPLGEEQFSKMNDLIGLNA